MGRLLCGAGVFACSLLFAQAPAEQPPDPLLPHDEVMRLGTRIVQLAEATTVSTPELARAGTVLLENARLALANLRRSEMELDNTYRFLTAMRAYLALADIVAKPYPFPDAAAKQFTELRDDTARLDSHFRALLAVRDRARDNPDPDDLARYGDADTRLNPPNPARPRVVFMGDSITDGWRLNEYFPDHDFVNRGISGQMTDQMLGRFEADVIALRPVAVIILGGTNDLWRGTSVAAIANNIRMMCTLAQAYGIKVLLSSVLPVSDYHKNVNPDYERTPRRRPEQIRELNRWLESFCAQHGYRFVDYYSEMVDASGFLKPDLSDDDLHPNTKGYRIMAPVALTAIEGAVSATPQQKPKRRRLFSNEE